MFFTKTRSILRTTYTQFRTTMSATTNSTSSHIDKSFKFNHTCLRIKDPKRSIPFYESHFGMKLLEKKDFEAGKFSNYLLGIASNEGGSSHPRQREGVLELTHNWGTESQPDFKINNGNQEPYKGFGHICFSVVDIEKFCDELESKDVKFQKKLTDGRQKEIAFALDPDGYWIELIAKQDTNNKPSFNHTMIRVKDPQESLKFYREILGMKLFSISKHENAKFTLYFLGYEHSPFFQEGQMVKQAQSQREAILELTHNWGTETDADFKGYHNGNDDDGPKGFSNIGITCDDPKSFVKSLQETYGDKLNWKLQIGENDEIKELALLSDPDNYTISILPTGSNSK